jgi:hypothetical protein
MDHSSHTCCLEAVLLNWFQDVDMSLHVGQEFSMVPPGEPSVSFARKGDSLVGETFSRTIGLMRIAASMMALLTGFAYCYATNRNMFF